MKYLKLFENYNREDIDSICKKYGIKNIFTQYTINGGSIDVDGGVNLYGKGLTELPLKFRNISGYFNCSNNKLTSLKGCPESVGDYFYCNNNKLTTLEGCPEYIDGLFDCSDNRLSSLEGGPKSISCSYFANDNEIRTLEGFPINLEGDFYCTNNPVWELWILFEDKYKVELFNDFGITDGEVVILERLNEFLEMIGNPILTDTRDLEKEGYKII